MIKAVRPVGPTVIPAPIASGGQAYLAPAHYCAAANEADGMASLRIVTVIDAFGQLVDLPAMERRLRAKAQAMFAHANLVAPDVEYEPFLGLSEETCQAIENAWPLEMSPTAEPGVILLRKPPTEQLECAIGYNGADLKVMAVPRLLIRSEKSSRDVGFGIALRDVLDVRRL